VARGLAIDAKDVERLELRALVDRALDDKTVKDSHRSEKRCDREGSIHMAHYMTLVIGIAVGGLLAAAAVPAGPIDPARHPYPENAKVVHEAEHGVDHAWEVYHRAALGGTVASPALQAKIEQHLHEARTLITQAQDAADRGDKRRVQRLVGQIKSHTSHAIEGSKEQKK
jgi:hypothetical protein